MSVRSSAAGRWVIGLVFWSLVPSIEGCGLVGPAEVAPGPELAAPTVLDRLQGAWLRTLDDEQAADLRMLSFAFADPLPTEEAANELVLDELRLKILKAILAFRRGNLESELVKFRATYQELRNSKVVFERDKLTFEFGDARNETRFMVIRNTADEAILRLAANDEDVTVRFDGAVIHLTNGADLDQRFTRVNHPDAQAGAAP